MKKRITAFLLTAVMLLGALAGCGGPANNSGGGNGDGGSGGDNTSRSLKIRKVNSLASTDYDVVTYTEDMSILSDNVFQGLYGMDRPAAATASCWLRTWPSARTASPIRLRWWTPPSRTATP